MSARFTLSWLLMGPLFCAPAMAQAPPATNPQAEARQEDRVRFHQLVRQRDQLHAQLRQLDARAVAAMKDGQKPTEIHAEQVSVEDKLDLTNLQLEMLAARHGLAVPPMPGSAAATQQSEKQAAGDRARYERAFARGRARAIGELGRQSAEFLASLDFERFINE